MRGISNIPVIGVIVRRDNKILFVLRKNTGWMDGHYVLPGGHLEEGESFRQAACRELLEETGIQITPNQLEHRITYQKKDGQGEIRVGVYFEAIGWQGEPRNVEPEVHEAVEWLDPDSLPDNMAPATLEKIKLIKDGINYVEQGWEE